MSVNENSREIGSLLIVDDEPDLLDILSDALGPLNLRIQTALNGRDALKIVRSGDVDAVLTDINMPIMSGLQLLAECRQLGMQLPFVVLTAFGDKANVLEAIRLDATDFLEKPFRSSEVLTVIDRVIKFGVALRELDSMIEKLFEGSTLPPDEIARIKKFKKVVMGMKLGAAAFAKKSA